MIARWTGLSLLASCLLSGCGAEEENWLDGSATAAYPMDFERIRIRLYPSELAVEYLADTDELSDLVALRVTVVNDGLSEGVSIDLAARGTMTRSEAWGAPLPDLESGALELTTFTETDGSDIAGTFSALLESSDESQLTLRGGFAGSLETVEL